MFAAIIVFVASAVAIAVVLFPLYIAKGLIDQASGSGFAGFRGRSQEEYNGKTREDLKEKAKERVETFLNDNDLEYVRDRDFKIEETNSEITVPFYLPDSNTAIILDEWYEEYLLSKNVGLKTIIIEIHDNKRYQYEVLRTGLGIQDDWRGRLKWEDGADEAFVSDIEVLGIDEEDITFEDLRNAYRERIKETHPDQNDSETAEKEFMRVKEAYENLKAEFEPPEAEA
ncbi:MAG: J domain-containing protein [Halobacteria archaeon]|nr:J domain-containing protein [Halobacteria archaeon]